MKPDAAPTDEAEKTHRHLFFVMSHATAIGFGLLAAFLYSMKDIPDDVTLEFSAGTIVLFAIGYAIGWLFWRGVKYFTERESRAQ